MLVSGEQSYQHVGVLLDASCKVIPGVGDWVLLSIISTFVSVLPICYCCIGAWTLTMNHSHMQLL